jgi:hypothetical protein
MRSSLKISLADRIRIIRVLFPGSRGADLRTHLRTFDHAILATSEGEGKAERDQAFQHYLEEEKERKDLN